MTFVHPAYIDLNGKTYLLGDFKINDQDFSQYPVIELLDPDKPNQRTFGKTKLMQVHKIVLKKCHPAPGVFEDPSSVMRIIIYYKEDIATIKSTLVRTQCRRSRGDMLLWVV